MRLKRWCAAFSFFFHIQLAPPHFGAARDLECVSPAGAGGTAVTLRARNSPGGWATPRGGALQFHYELGGSGAGAYHTAIFEEPLSLLSPRLPPLAKGLVGSSGPGAVAWLAASAAGGPGHVTWCITAKSTSAASAFASDAYAYPAVVVSSRLVGCETQAQVRAAGAGAGVMVATRLSSEPW